jgi:hypothetical protein
MQEEFFGPSSFSQSAIPWICLSGTVTAILYRHARKGFEDGSGLAAKTKSPRLENTPTVATGLSLWLLSGWLAVHRYAG